MGTQLREIGGNSENEPRKAELPEDPDILDIKNFRDYSFRKEGYFQIDRNTLVAGTAVDFSIVRQKLTRFETVIKAESGSPVVLNKEVLAKLTADRANEIVIQKSSLPLYYAYLNSLQDTPGLPENEAIQRKALVLKENSKILMKDLLENPRSGEKIKEVRNVVNAVTDSLLENRDTIYSMITLSKYDYYTYTHCVNVATLSIGLGVAAGLDKETVRRLGTGAMLHDIGKTNIPPEILNKQGSLDDYEYKRIQEHVNEGEMILRGHRDIPGEAYDAVLQHHEKLSGKGYPRRLRGDEIRLFGRIAAIADCYDALTTERPYKKAFTPFEALKIIAKETMNYDAALLALFIRMLGKVSEQ